MSYDLVYRNKNGDELIFMADTLDEVNAEIRKLYDEGEDITVLCIEEHQDTPRTWAIRYDPAPPAGTRFRTKDGREFEVGPDGRVMVGMTSWSWKGVLEDCAPLTEVVETEVEAAARRLREQGYAEGAPKRRPGGDEWTKDVRTVLAHVLNGGTL